MTLDHRTVLQRGVRRKELDPGLDFELALDLLGGPLFYRLLITGGRWTMRWRGASWT